MTKDRQTLHFNDKSQTKMTNLLMLISVCLSEVRVLWIVTVHSTIPQFHKFRFFDITISSLLTHGCNLVSKTNFAIAIFLQWFLKVSKVSEEPHNNFSICQLVVFLVSLILIHANIDCNICNYNFFLAEITNPKKCRARYGLDRQHEWCKPCRYYSMILQWSF